MNIKKILIGGFILFILFIASPVQSIPLEIHGFLSQGYLQTDRGDYMVKTDDGTFKFNEMGFNVSNDISEDIRLGIQFISKSFGDLSENTSNVDWAYADYRWRNYLGFRFGRIKVPFGLYNEIRDIDMLRTSIFLPSCIYSESWRDTLKSIDGVGLYGYLSLNALGDINYQALTGHQHLSIDGGIAHYIERIGTFEITSLEAKKSYIGSVIWDLPIEGLSIGSSFLSNKFIEKSMIGDDFLYVPLRMATDTNAQLPEMLNQIMYEKTGSLETSKMISQNFIDLVIPQEYQKLDNKWPKEAIRNHHTVDFWILSLRYQLGDFTLSAEHLDMKLHNSYFLDDINLRRDSILWHAGGYYLSGTYNLQDWLEFGVYYSVFYDNKDDKSDEAYQKWNQLDSYKYSVAQLYQQSSKEIRKNFKNYANAFFAQSGQNVVLSDKDVESIELISNYEVNRIKYQDYNGWFKELVLSISSHINDQWTFKVEGHFIDGIALLDWTVNSGDIPRKRFLFASKVTFSF